jgi:hypothetical protein
MFNMVGNHNRPHDGVTVQDDMTSCHDIMSIQLLTLLPSCGSTVHSLDSRTGRLDAASGLKVPQ